MDSIRKILLRNTLTNYVVLIWRMITSIFITRFLFLGLGAEHYGFWALLWTIFGYSLLLDFGFGVSVQKFTAEVRVNKDMKEYNSLITAVLCTYLAITSVIIVMTFAAAPFLDTILSMAKNADISYYKTVFIIFGIGAALVFPTGIFPEILVGLNRTDLKNYVLFGTVTANIIGIYTIYILKYSLLALTVFSVSVNMISNLIMIVLVFKNFPGFRISPKFFHWSYVKKLGSFSIFAYIYAISVVIIFRTDRTVLGIMLGMEAVAVYQIGTRLSEMMQQLTTQFQKSLAPVTVTLFKNNEKERFKWVLMRSARITLFVSTLFFIIFFILVKQIMFIWLKVDNPNSIKIAHIMLISIYVTVIFKTPFLKSIQMAGKHKFVAYLSIAEGIVNILLSVYLVHTLKTNPVLGVAYGTIVPGLFFSIFLFFPVAAKFTGIKMSYYITKVFLPIILVVIPPLAILICATKYIPFASWNIFYLAAITGGTTLIYFISGLFFYIKKDEREKFLDALPMKDKIPFLNKL